MMSRILVISIMAEGALAALLNDLKQRHQEAEITALVGTNPRRAARRAPAEYLIWGSLGARRLIGELRRRRFDLVVVASGPDQCLSRGYWQALALAALSGSHRTLLCEEGRLVRGWTPLAALMRSASQLAAECYVAALGLVWLLPMLAAVAVTDLSEGPARGEQQERRARRVKDTD